MPLTDAERTDLHSKKIVLANRKGVLKQLEQQLDDERKRIEQLEHQIEEYKRRL